MKIHTSNGVEVMHGDQTAARQCNNTVVHGIRIDDMQISISGPELEQ